MAAKCFINQSRIARRIESRHKRNVKLVLLLVLAAVSPALEAATLTDLSSPDGLWAPTDGQGRPLGLIRIFEQDGVFYGRIEPSSPADDSSARCTHCTGERKDQPIIGLVIMGHLTLKDHQYVGGDILDPRTGWIYPSDRRGPQAPHARISGNPPAGAHANLGARRRRDRGGLQRGPPVRLAPQAM
jgi:hypothetical protein